MQFDLQFLSELALLSMETSYLEFEISERNSKYIWCLPSIQNFENIIIISNFQIDSASSKTGEKTMHHIVFQSLENYKAFKLRLKYPTDIHLRRKQN